MRKNVSRDSRRSIRWIALLLAAGLLAAGAAGGGQSADPIWPPRKVPLHLPVDDEVYYDFASYAVSLARPTAVELGLPNGKVLFYSVDLPDTFSTASEDPAERYLAMILSDSKDRGFDFSGYAGEELAGCLVLYANLGVSHAFLALCSPEGRVAGFWEDDYKKPADPERQLNHWSVLGVETKDLPCIDVNVVIPGLTQPQG